MKCSITIAEGQTVVNLTPENDSERVAFRFLDDAGIQSGYVRVNRRSNMYSPTNVKDVQMIFREEETA